MNQVAVSVSPNADNSVGCFRPTPWLWVPIILYFLLEGQLFTLVLTALFDGSGQVDRGIVILSVAALLIGIVMAFPLITLEIRTDADTLKWRTWRGWHKASWSQVTDYYETMEAQRRGLSARCEIVTPRGKCRFNHAGVTPWTRTNDLRRIVTERAVNAPAKQWALQGARPELDLPKTFNYTSPSSIWATLLMSVMGGSFAFFMVRFWFPGVWSIAVTIANGLGWIWGGAALLVLGAFGLASLYFPVLAIWMLAALKKNLNSHIIVSKEGLSYTDRKRRIDARWDEVTRIQPGAIGTKTIVETTHGTFDVSYTLHDYVTFMATLKASAEPAVIERWTAEQSRLEPARRFVASDGSHAYSYKTRSNRQLFWAALILPFTFCIPSLLGNFQAATINPSRLSIAVALLVTVPSLLGWLDYFVAGIRTDDGGITQFTIVGPKRILWADVTDVKSIGAEALTVVSGSNSTQRIWFSPLIADSKELFTEIKRRTQKEPEIS